MYLAELLDLMAINQKDLNELCISTLKKCLSNFKQEDGLWSVFSKRINSILSQEEPQLACIIIHEIAKDCHTFKFEKSVSSWLQSLLGVINKSESLSNRVILVNALVSLIISTKSINSLSKNLNSIWVPKTLTILTKMVSDNSDCSKALNMMILNFESLAKPFKFGLQEALIKAVEDNYDYISCLVNVSNIISSKSAESLELNHQGLLEKTCNTVDFILDQMFVGVTEGINFSKYQCKILKKPTLIAFM
jgi:hypothetical protein